MSSCKVILQPEEVRHCLVCIVFICFYVNDNVGYHFSAAECQFIAIYSVRFRSERILHPRRTIRFLPSRLYINKTSKEQTTNFFPHTSPEEAMCSQRGDIKYQDDLRSCCTNSESTNPKAEWKFSHTNAIAQPTAHVGGAVSSLSTQGVMTLASSGRLTFLKFNKLNFIHSSFNISLRLLLERVARERRRQSVAGDCPSTPTLPVSYISHCRQ